MLAVLQALKREMDSVSAIGSMEYRSGLCGKELKRWGPASMGRLECMMFLLLEALMWKPGASGASARKIIFMDASRAHCQADATSEMEIELPPEEQVNGEDLLGELLKSPYGTREEEHK